MVNFATNISSKVKIFVSHLYICSQLEKTMLMLLIVLLNVVTQFSNFQEGILLILHRFCACHFICVPTAKYDSMSGTKISIYVLLLKDFEKLTNSILLFCYYSMLPNWKRNKMKQRTKRWWEPRSNMAMLYR